MDEDFDARIRTSLLTLAESAAGQASASPRRTPAQRRSTVHSALPVGGLTFACVLLVAAVALVQHGGSQPAPAASPAVSGSAVSSSSAGTPAPTSTASESPRGTEHSTATPRESTPTVTPSPTGGLSEAQAVAIARAMAVHAWTPTDTSPRTPTFRSAVAGRFGEVYTRVGTATPDRLVWVISFDGSYGITHCGGVAAKTGDCIGPFAHIDLVLDYFTGEWLEGGEWG